MNPRAANIIGIHQQRGFWLRCFLRSIEILASGARFESGTALFVKQDLAQVLKGHGFSRAAK